MDTAAVFWPVDVGLNVTLTAQLLPAPTELPQVFVCVKSPGLAPVMAMLVTLNVPGPLLVRVTVLVAPLFPMRTLPQFKLVADRLTAGAVPVPDKLAVWGLLLALSVTVRVAVRVPVVVGVKVTLIVQLDAAGILDPHVLVGAAKSPLLVPVTAMLVMLKAVLPGFERVTI